MALLLMTFLISTLSTTLADYACLCSYATDKPLYEQPVTTSNVIGHLYEFDCKPEYTGDTSLTADWKAVMIDHHIGYFKDSTAVSSEICQGSIPTHDKVTTGPSSTQQITTSTNAPTRFISTTALTTALSSYTPNSIVLHSNTSTPRTNPVTAMTTGKSTTKSKLSTSLFTTPQTSQQVSSASSQKMPSPITSIPHRSTTTKAPTSTTKSTPKMTITTKRTTSPTTRKTPPPVTQKVTSGPGITYQPKMTYKCPDNVLRAAFHNQGRTRIYGTTCYELVPYYYNWYNAETNCKNKGGHLVHVQNMVEENNLMRFLYDNNFRHAVWLGLTDLNQENHFYWTSGDPVTFTKWKPGHISNFDSHHVEDCVVLVPYIKSGFLGSHGLWDDIHCGDGHPWVCQYNAEPVQSLSGYIFGNGGYNPGGQHGSGHNHLVFTTKTPVIGGLGQVLDIIGRK